MNFKNIVIVALASCLVLTTVIVFVAPNLIFAQQKAPYTHELIVEQTIVQLEIGDSTFYLEPHLLSPKKQKVVALDIVDLSRRLEWINKTVDFSVWSWEYKGQTLVYQRVWGLHEGEYFVDFSKATMSKIVINCFGNQHTFKMIFPETYGQGYWWIWIEEGVAT